MWNSWMYSPARVWMGFWFKLLSRLTKRAHRGGVRWLLTRTMQAVCTDGHFDTKKGQETKNTVGPALHNASPQGGCTFKTRLRIATEARRDWGQRARRNHAPHTSAASRQLPDAQERLKTLIQMCSIRATCVTIENSLQARAIETLTTCLCGELIGVTYISLLCISSMRSVKRTSRFLSQKPSAS